MPTGGGHEKCGPFTGVRFLLNLLNRAFLGWKQVPGLNFIAGKAAQPLIHRPHFDP